MGAGRLVVSVVALVVVFLQGIQGTTWRVGDSNGWKLTVNYSQWKQGKVFEVGDVLLFTYNKSTENLLEVSGADYRTCTTVAPIAAYSDGNSSVLLSNLTTRFFISSIPGHCLVSMALEIQMGVQSPSPAPASSSASPPAPALIPSPTPSPPQSAPSPVSQISSPPPPLPSSAPPGFTVAMLLPMATSIGAALMLFIETCFV